MIRKILCLLFLTALVASARQNIVTGGVITSDAWKWARLKSVTANADNGALEFRVGWPDVEPGYVIPEIGELSQIAFVTNPTVNGDVLSKTFAVSVRAQDSDTRKQDVELVLTEVFEPSTVADLAALGNRRMDENEILNVLGLFEGEADTRGYVWDNIHTDQRDTLMGLEDSTLVSQFATSFAYVSRKFDEQKNGTASFSLAFRYPTWTNSWEDALKMSEANPGGYGRTRGYIVQGVSNTNLTDLLTDGVQPPSGYVLKGLRVSEGADGSLSAQQDVAISYNGAASSDATVLFYQEATGNRERQIRRWWPRRTEAAKNILVDTGGAAVEDWYTVFPGDPSTSGTKNVHANVSIQDNADGTFDVIQTLVNPNMWWTGSYASLWKSSYKFYSFKVNSKGEFMRWTYLHIARGYGSEEAAWNGVKYAGEAGMHKLPGASVHKSGPTWVMRVTLLDGQPIGWTTNWASFIQQ